MIVYRIAQEKYIKDLGGMGSYLFGGRWTLKGTFAIYTALHKSLAYLEYVVHQFGQDTWPLDLRIATLEVESNNIISLESGELPENWDSISYNYNTQIVSSKAFENGVIGISVPSVILKSERNLILNPHYINFSKKVKMVNVEAVELDERFMG